MRRRRSSGFTLIEVLIAATILFASLVIISESYRESMASSRKADAIAKMLTPLPLIVSGIRNDLRENPTERREGEGDMLGVHYRFQASTVRFEPPPTRFDPDTTMVTSYAPRYRLYDVKLRLELGEESREFIFQELAWLPLQRN
jgi:type II secretory pathway component PulJ